MHIRPHMIIDTIYATDPINYDCADRSLANLCCISCLYICAVYHHFLLQAKWDLNLEVLLFRKSCCHDVSPRQCTYGGALGASCDLLSRLVGGLDSGIRAVRHALQYDTDIHGICWLYQKKTISWHDNMPWWGMMYTLICHDLPYVFVLFGVQVGGPVFFLYWASGIHQPVGPPKWLFGCLVKESLPKNLLNSGVGKLW